MTTKEQERKALEKIRKTVSELGEDSYIGTAFDGCFEDAETNIEYDFAFSYKQRYESIVKKEAEQGEQIAMLLQKIDVLEEKLHDCNSALADARKALDRETQSVLDERKDLYIKTNGQSETEVMEKTMPFASVRYVNKNGFRFITIEEKSGWMTSVKLDDIEELTIE